MVQQAGVAPVQEVSAQDSPVGALACPHHWVIQAAEGPTSAGVCRICGETREFKNYVESASWGDTRLLPAPAPVSPQAIISSKDAWDDE